ncbi:gamma carbonic anhydrase family protein [Sphingosinicella rhizophila]|uniref:Gamma carbonic anhydrase family protein n=1 Tax=Sphingosinicella rhizophila TaxID=3050082 RepID=A0ABU3Q615_9SPHN|nr:gamma carbonic anhydrase family protein [Sphingosinicella sp. GR2756]MDT9598851.1 gamma carbonic anhydrase family protein [Sphingosinicella sp. GR2756]
MQQPAKQKKVLKAALRSHDPDAARQLLAHSMALGHERLAVGRYLAAHYLGCRDLAPFQPYCRTAVRRFKPQALLTLAAKVARELHLDVDIHCALGDLLVAELPHISAYGDTAPSLESAPRYCGPRVSLLGSLTIGPDPWFGPGAVIRAEGNFARIGEDFRLGEGSIVHIAHEPCPVQIGRRVTAGQNVVIHGCTVGDDCLIEDNATILDGAAIGNGAVIAAGSVISPHSVLQSGWLHSGSPAKAVRPVDPGEYEQRKAAISDSVFASIFDRTAQAGSDRVGLGENVFIARTAASKGRRHHRVGTAPRTKLVRGQSAGPAA